MAASELPVANASSEPSSALLLERHPVAPLWRQLVRGAQIAHAHEAQLARMQAVEAHAA